MLGFVFIGGKTFVLSPFSFVINLETPTDLIIVLTVLCAKYLLVLIQLATRHTRAIGSFTGSYRYSVALTVYFHFITTNKSIQCQ